MSWQKCPICNGYGCVDVIVCTVCRGHKIISTITGLPPQFSQGTEGTVTVKIEPFDPLNQEPSSTCDDPNKCGAV